MNKLYVLSHERWEVGAAALHRLAGIAPELALCYLPGKRLKQEHMADAEVIFGFPHPPLLRFASGLRWLHLPSAGAENYADLRLYAHPQVTVTHSAGVYGVPMAEHALMLLLALLRGLFTPEVEPEEARELQGATVAILGLGDVGRALAERLSPFACHIIGVRRNLMDKPPFVHELADTRKILYVLSQSDYTFCCLPLTHETAGLLSHQAFQAMKPGSVFVNVGRGAVVDTDALTQALAKGPLWGAGLDVTEPEPLPDDHPLRAMPRVIVTSHVAGGSVNVAARRLALFEQQLTRYVTGRSLRNTVDFFRGY